jgi:hypothetical protein
MTIARNDETVFGPEMKWVVVHGLRHRKPQRLLRGKHPVVFLSHLLNLTGYRYQRPAAASGRSSDALNDGSLLHSFAHDLL